MSWAQFNTIMPGLICFNVIKAKGCSFYFFWPGGIFAQDKSLHRQAHIALCSMSTNEHTSKTFFLLDLSFEAQPIVAPRSSTVTSGTIWLVLFCAEGQKYTAVFKIDGDTFHKTSCNKHKAVTVTVGSWAEGSPAPSLLVCQRPATRCSLMLHLFNLFKSERMVSFMRCIETYTWKKRRRKAGGWFSLTRPVTALSEMWRMRHERECSIQVSELLINAGWVLSSPVTSNTNMWAYSKYYTDHTEEPVPVYFGSLWNVNTPPWRTVHVWAQFFLKWEKKHD